MDEQRFDQLARTLARGTTRRRLLAGIAGAIGGLSGIGAASAKPGKDPNGTPCKKAKKCRSGFCIDGYCCDSACVGTCESCGLRGHKGACTAVVGAPVGNRGDCPGDGGVCSGVCDGNTTSHCAGFPSDQTACGPTTCVDGWLSASTCSGNGACVTSTWQCGPLGCAADGASCREGCLSDADCPEHTYCVEGSCWGDLGIGENCERSEQCQSMQCINGICCDSVCNGECQACGSDGICRDLGDGAACSGGSCCSGLCVDLDNNLGHCGQCGNACPTDSGNPCLADATCVGGNCGYMAIGDGASCDDGDYCTYNDVCIGGSCLPGEYVDCTGLPNADAVCSYGEYVIQSCYEGWADCDGSSWNGCETQTYNNPDHCGGCGNFCPPNSGCAGTYCACIGGTVDCFGECVKLGTNMYCSGCEDACLDGQNCVNGACI